MACCASTEEPNMTTDTPCDAEPTTATYTPAEDVELEANPVGVAKPEVRMPHPRAPELLGRAAMHMHDRAATYDAPSGERSMGKTVAAFNAITGRDIDEGEGWLFMALLKQVRLFTRSEYHADSAEDAIAYLALLAEAKGDGR